MAIVVCSHDTSVLRALPRWQRVAAKNRPELIIEPPSSRADGIHIGAIDTCGVTRGSRTGAVTFRNRCDVSEITATAGHGVAKTTASC